MVLSSLASGAPPALAPPSPEAQSADPESILTTATAIEDLSLALNLLQDATKNEPQEPLPAEAKTLEPLKPFAQAAVDLVNVLAEVLSPLHQEYKLARAKFDNGGVAPTTTETPVVIGKLIFDDEPASVNSISEPVQPVTPIQLVVPVQPETPVQPVVPFQQETPVQPVVPVQPFSLVKQKAANNPVQTIQPFTPAKSTVSFKPVSTIKPVRTAKPITTVKPVTTTKPAATVEPEALAQPFIQVQPTHPFVPSSTFEVLKPTSKTGTTSLKVAPKATVPGFSPLAPLEINIPANAKNGYSYTVHTPNGFYTQIFYG